MNSIEIVRQGFRDREPCFFVQCNGGGIISGYLEDSLLKAFFGKSREEQQEKRCSISPVAVFRDYFHMVQADRVGTDWFS